MEELRYGADIAPLKESEVTLPLKDKEERLQELLRKFTSDPVVLAFSSGADSSLLLKELTLISPEVRLLPVFIDSFLNPRSSLESAQSFCKSLNLELTVLSVNELNHPLILNNDKSRCYHCKSLLFKTLKEYAKAQGAATVMDGTNYDDLFVYRPGLQALRELKILSPLALSALTKEEIRALGKEYQLKATAAPSSPCLATRFPYGTPLTRGDLERVAMAESCLKKFGFYNVRVRVHGSLARLELDAGALIRALALKEAIVKRIRELGFKYVTLDLEGFRSGSMD